MSFRLFQYALPAPPDLEDLNAFVAGHRVAAVAHHVVTISGSAMLLFVVETLPGTVPRHVAQGPPRTDYREQLSEEDFAVFSRLRAERKRLAEEEGVPVYTVLTNAQLAEMVKRRVSSKEDIAGIEGIGKARVERYGARMLAVLATFARSAEEAREDPA